MACRGLLQGFFFWLSHSAVGFWTGRSDCGKKEKQKEKKMSDRKDKLLQNVKKTFIFMLTECLNFF